MSCAAVCSHPPVVQRLSVLPRSPLPWLSTATHLLASFSLYTLFFRLLKWSFIPLHPLMAQHHIILYTLNYIEYMLITLVFTVVVPHIVSRARITPSG